MTSPARKGPFPVPAAGLSDDARKAITQSFEALQDWRREVAGSTEKYADNVFDKMGAAAKAMGWPENLIEASKAQMKQVSQMQVTMIDQIMDTWQNQVKSPGSMPSMPSMPANPTGMPGMGSFPGLGQMPQFGGHIPGMPDLSGMPLAAPMQFWMQAADMWQKSWQQAMSQWMDMQPGSGQGDRRR